MANKQEALQEIITIAENHRLSVDEVVAAMRDKQAIAVQQSHSILSRMFGYIGSILVFAGICILIGMQWDQLTSGERVAITLGSGFIAFLLGLAAMDHPKYDRAATPFLLMAALFQPTGIVVILDEYSRGGDPLYGVLFMSIIMLIQQGAIFCYKQRTTLAFTTIFFGCSFFFTAMSLLEIDGNLIALTVGTSLMCISWALSNSPHRTIAAFWYLIGSCLLLISTFDLLQDSPFEVLYLGLTATLIYISTTARSRVLLLVGTVSMLAYISYFTYEHFSNALGWPLVLIICGIAFIAIGSIAMKINNRYLRESR